MSGESSNKRDGGNNLIEIRKAFSLGTMIDISSM
jgi:hypothetical protein